MQHYDQDYIDEALKLASEIGNKAASTQLGIPLNTLTCWKYKGGKVSTQGRKKRPKTAEEWEQKYNDAMSQLREANKQIAKYKSSEEEKDEKIKILQDCLAFFAEDRKKT